jgi:hypothetical protein
MNMMHEKRLNQLIYFCSSSPHAKEIVLIKVIPELCM